MTEDSHRRPSPEWPGSPTAGRGYDRGGHPYYEYVAGPPDGDDRVGLTYDGFVRPRPSAENAGDWFGTPAGDYRQVDGYGHVPDGFGGPADDDYRYADGSGAADGYGVHQYAADPDAAHAHGADQYPADQYPADQYPADSYAADPYAPDQYPAGGYAPFPNAPGPYGSDAAAAPTELIPATTGLIDLSVSRPLPVTHRGRQRRHAAVLATAAVAVMLAGGVGYALFRPSGPETTAGPAAVLTTDGPTTEPDETLDLFPEPSGAPVRSASASATPSSAAPSVGATTTPATTAPAAGPAPTATTPESDPTGPIALPPAPAPTGTATRPGISPTELPRPPAAPAGQLNASFSQEERDDGVVGTVRVTNPGNGAANGFTVRLTVPGGANVRVLSGNVSVSRNGDAVTFRGGGPVSAGGSVSFTFAVEGPLSGRPGGCTIDGNACS